MKPRDPSTRWRRRARSLRAGIALAAAIVLGAVPAGADPLPLLSPAVQSWLQGTAARALEAAEPDNDLHVGGVAMLNRSLQSGLDIADRLAPRWLQRVDAGVRFDRDLHAAYRLATVQPVVRVDGGRHVVDLQARFAYEPTGATTSRLGLGYHGVGPDETLDASLRGGLEQKTDYERYILETELDWSSLSVSGRVFDDVPLDEAGAASARRDPLLDGYDLDAEVRVPYVSWLRARATLSWRDADGEGLTRDRLSLEFQPLSSLRIETGTSGQSGEVRAWFARLRVELEFGGPA